MPKYLRGKVFTRTFPCVMETLSQRIRMVLKTEYINNFKSDYAIGNPQKVDFVFFQEEEQPFIFLELESLDRAQLYLFTDGQVSNNITKDNDNKLWYYYGTVGNICSFNREGPRYFVFLLILPDKKVDRYPLWDIQKEYRLFHPKLRSAVYANPYEFYDYQIKASARGFLRSENCRYFERKGKWVEVDSTTYQKKCELIFITCTSNSLILSRGKDFFDPLKEITFPIKW